MGAGEGKAGSEPQGLKPASWVAIGGTAEAVPFHKPGTKRKRPSRFLSTAFINAGNYLLSHTLSRAVQSAQRGLT